MDWIGSGLENWTHVELWSGSGRSNAPVRILRWSSGYIMHRVGVKCQLRCTAVSSPSVGQTNRISSLQNAQNVVLESRLQNQLCAVKMITPSQRKHDFQLQIQQGIIYPSHSGLFTF